MIHGIRLALVCTAACGFLGCSGLLNTAAGPGDDFPNSKSVLGKAIAGGLGSSSDWTRTNSVPDTISDSVAQGITTAESLFVQPAAGAQKKSEADLVNESWQWDMSDSAKGFVVLYHLKEGLVTLTQDTLTILYRNAADTAGNAKKVLKIYGKEYNKLNANSLYYHLLDTDENGFFDQGGILYVIPQIGFAYVIAAAGTSGNDNNFTDKSKLRLSFVRACTIAGYDTLGLVEISDADRDGAIYDSNAAKNTVDVRIKSVSTSPLSPVYLFEARTRLELGTADLKTTKTVRHEWFAKYNDGRSEAFSLRGTAPDSSFHGLDTATAIYTRCDPDSGAVDTVIGSFSVALDRDFPASMNNKLLSFTLGKKTPAGAVIDLQLSVIFADPVLKGEPPESKAGIFNAAITYNTGAMATINGNFTSSAITGHYTAPDGTKKDFIWDRNGN